MSRSEHVIFHNRVSANCRTCGHRRNAPHASEIGGRLRLFCPDCCTCNKSGRPQDGRTAVIAERKEN
jgi:hypothetical protein